MPIHCDQPGTLSTDTFHTAKQAVSGLQHSYNNSMQQHMHAAAAAQHRSQLSAHNAALLHYGSTAHAEADSTAAVAAAMNMSMSLNMAAAAAAAAAAGWCGYPVDATTAGMGLVTGMNAPLMQLQTGAGATAMCHDMLLPSKEPCYVQEPLSTSNRRKRTLLQDELCAVQYAEQRAECADMQQHERMMKYSNFGNNSVLSADTDSLSSGSSDHDMCSSLSTASTVSHSESGSVCMPGSRSSSSTAASLSCTLSCDSLAPSTCNSANSTRPSSALLPATAAAASQAAATTATHGSNNAAAAAPARKRKWSSEARGALVGILSCVLERLFSSPHDQLPSDPRAITCFHTDRIPSISIGQYLERIAYYSDCSEECLVSAVIQISRIYYSQNAPLKINSLSIHRLLLTSILVNGKFHDDHYFNNAFFARVGGVSPKEMNILEVEFLALIAFDLFVSPAVYSKFYVEITNNALHNANTCNCSQSLQHIANINELYASQVKQEADVRACVGEAAYNSELAQSEYNNSSYMDCEMKPMNAQMTAAAQPLLFELQHSHATAAAANNCPTRYDSYSHVQHSHSHSQPLIQHAL